MPRMRVSPNPFGSRARLQFELEQRGQVSCRVFDVTGSQVAVLADLEMNAGQHELCWVATEAGPGTYFVELRTSAGIKCARLVKAQ
ncbi:MAG: T9SS type A sorting domain-containing protein [candidate division WOR-3 bacterium]|nr:MAG: T9SS type A sorting domain-containing protein [candidate division WOR-3 bacterium]